MIASTARRGLRPGALLGRSRGRRQASTPSPGGEIVKAEGHSIHIRRQAEPGRPWVVLESALGCPCTEWAWVQTHLANRGINSLAWDRPGIGGTSPAGRSADTAARHVGRLEALMRSEGIDGAVLVDHSVGALLVRAFAAAHPDRVLGLVLVEGSHPRQRERSPRQGDLMAAMQRRLASGPPTRFVDTQDASSGLPRHLRDWTAHAASGRAAAPRPCASCGASIGGHVGRRPPEHRHDGGPRDSGGRGGGESRPVCGPWHRPRRRMNACRPHTREET